MRHTSAAITKISHAAADPLVRAALWFAAAVVAATILLAASGLALVTLLVVVGAAFGAISIKENESSKDLRAPLPEVWNATVDALGENGYVFGEPTWYGATEGWIHAGDAKVVVERHPGEVTRVRVRVGKFDTDENKRRAGLILESVAKRVA